GVKAMIVATFVSIADGNVAGVLGIAFAVKFLLPSLMYASRYLVCDRMHPFVVHLHSGGRILHAQSFFRTDIGQNRSVAIENLVDDIAYQFRKPKTYGNQMFP